MRQTNKRADEQEDRMGGLDGQVAIVTGGGSGIGEATAVALARDGARVAVVGRRREPLEAVVTAVTSAGGAAFAASVDVADPEAVAAVAQAVVERWGRVDLLVNNAGVNVPQRELVKMSVADWNTVVQVNLTGTFLMTQAVLPVMRRQQSGTVVNVSSIAGYRVSELSGPAYTAAKAGVNALTESLNLAERRHGIRACAICPGEVATPILDKRPQPPSPEARATMLQPEDLAATVLFVAALPQRATVELLTILPTVQRDVTAELG
jgi:NADP-dependent 3-hydroxy acid dehydrogenase YdfG